MPEAHEGLPVHGYQSQSQIAIDEVNRNKVLEEQVLQRLDDLGLVSDVDKRWLAIGRTHIEQAFMAINRSIFKPKRVQLEEEKPNVDAA